jgi:hypothetical protein
MKLLFKMLKEEVDARVALPSAAKIRHYQEVVRTNFPDLDGSWRVMDGLKNPIPKSGDKSMQNAYYNCVFIFAPSRVVIACIGMTAT